MWTSIAMHAMLSPSDGGTRASWTRMHLAAAQAASHPSGFNGGLASSGAGTRGCVVPVIRQPRQETAGANGHLHIPPRGTVLVRDVFHYPEHGEGVDL